MIKALARATLVAWVMLLPACESLYLFSDANVARVRQELIEEHRMRAMAREAEGGLRGALEEWRVVEALAPESEEAHEKIRSLRRRIDARVKFHMTTATDALRRDDMRNARLHLLKALALKPSNKSTADLLRKIENRQVAANFAKSSTEPRIIGSGETIDPYSSPSPGRGYPEEHDRSAHDYGQEGVAVLGEPTGSVDRGAGSKATRAAHLRLAAIYRAEGRLEKALEHLLKAKEQEKAANGEVDRYIAETKAALAEQYYREGVQSFRSDLDQSIQAFERALDYDPEHERAKHYLSTASRLRQQRKVTQPVPEAAQ